MDIGRPIIFIPVVIYCLYSFRKSKLNIHLIIGTLSWYSAFYSGKYNVYQFIQDPFKSMIDMVSIALLLITLYPYLKKSVVEYKEYKSSINIEEKS